MRGMVFLGDRRVAIRDFPAPAPGPGEAVVKIRAAGLCGSDPGLYRGERAAVLAAKLIRCIVWLFRPYVPAAEQVI